MTEPSLPSSAAAVLSALTADAPVGATPVAGDGSEGPAAAGPSADEQALAAVAAGAPAGEPAGEASAAEKEAEYKARIGAGGCWVAGAVEPGCACGSPGGWGCAGRVLGAGGVLGLGGRCLCTSRQPFRTTSLSIAEPVLHAALRAALPAGAVMADAKQQQAAKAERVAERMRKRVRLHAGPAAGKGTTCGCGGLQS